MLEMLVGLLLMCEQNVCMWHETEHNVTLTVCAPVFTANREGVYNRNGAKTLTVYSIPCQEA